MCMLEGKCHMTPLLKNCHVGSNCLRNNICYYGPRGGSEREKGREKAGGMGKEGRLSPHAHTTEVGRILNSVASYRSCCV